MATYLLVMEHGAPCRRRKSISNLVDLTPVPERVNKNCVCQLRCSSSTFAQVLILTSLVDSIERVALFTVCRGIGTELERLLSVTLSLLAKEEAIE